MFGADDLLLPGMMACFSRASSLVSSMEKVGMTPVRDSCRLEDKGGKGKRRGADRAHRDVWKLSCDSQLTSTGLYR